MMTNKQKIEEFVRDLNYHLNDSTFLPEKPDGEFKFSIDQVNEKTFTFYFRFEDSETKLPLVVRSYYISDPNSEESMDRVTNTFYHAVFRYAHFSVDTIKSGLVDKESGLPIYSLTINTLFKEGLKQLKTNKTV